MFENVRAMANLAKELPRLKGKVTQIREELRAHRAHAQAGGGAVRATVSGDLRLVALHVEPALVAGLGNGADTGLATDLIVSAINSAMDQARAHAEARMRGAAEELGIELPPGLSL